MPELKPAFAELESLLETALSADPARLENYLAERSNLPGPRGNLELIYALARLVAQKATSPDLEVAPLESLLDRWAALSLEEAPVNSPGEILPACAALAYGFVAAARPGWWPDESAKLRRLADNPRWRTREMVAAAYQEMLDAAWERGLSDLRGWLAPDELLAARAVVAAVAEPRLLKPPGRARQALALQAEACRALAEIPPEQRRAENFKTLRQALGYALSVVTVAAPAEGFALLEELSSSPDRDLQWVVRENLKKKRLAPWPEQVAALQKRLSL